MTQSTASDAPPRKPIRSIVPSDYVDGVYSILNPQVGSTRSGKPFLKCILRDASGECPARQWTIDDTDVPSLKATGFVWIAGRAESYQDQLQIVIEQIRTIEVTPEELRELVPSSRFDIDMMFGEVRSLLETIEDPAANALAQAYLNDEKLMMRFREAPAAVSLHHAWLGGLLEHTWQLMRLAERMLPLYPALNRDLVLLGLFLHDLGKTTELSWNRGFHYTAQGELIGHIVIGALWLDRKVREVAEAGGPILQNKAHLVLTHIILSHHTEPEFGAAKRPSTPEAIFIALLDNLDARTAMSVQHARPELSEDGPQQTQQSLFTDKVWALETKLYCPDPFRSDE